LGWVSDHLASGHFGFRVVSGRVGYRVVQCRIISVFELYRVKAGRVGFCQLLNVLCDPLKKEDYTHAPLNENKHKDASLVSLNSRSTRLSFLIFLIKSVLRKASLDISKDIVKFCISYIDSACYG
jgi:hypothetical protein